MSKCIAEHIKFRSHSGHLETYCHVTYWAGGHQAIPNIRKLPKVRIEALPTSERIFVYTKLLFLASSCMDLAKQTSPKDQYRRRLGCLVRGPRRGEAHQAGPRDLPHHVRLDRHHLADHRTPGRQEGLDDRCGELAITVLEKIARLRELSGDSSMDKAETMVLTELIKVGFGAVTAYTKLFDDSGCMRAGLNLQEQLPCIVSCHKMKVKFLALPIVSGKGVVLQGSANASHAKDISDSIKAHLESLNASFQKALDTITQDLAQATP